MYRPQQKQVVVLRDGQEIYLCKAITAASIPTVTVFREVRYVTLRYVTYFPYLTYLLTYFEVKWSVRFFWLLYDNFAIIKCIITTIITIISRLFPQSLMPSSFSLHSFRIIIIIIVFAIACHTSFFILLFNDKGAIATGPAENRTSYHFKWSNRVYYWSHI